MKKDQNHIDDLFQSKLSEREFDLPQGFVDDLNQKLDQKGKTTFPWLLFASIVVLSSLSVFILSPKKTPLINISADDFIQLSLQQNHSVKEESSAALAQLKEEEEIAQDKVLEENKSAAETGQNKTAANKSSSQRLKRSASPSSGNTKFQSEKSDNQPDQTSNMSTNKKLTSHDKNTFGSGDQSPQDDQQSKSNTASQTSNKVSANKTNNEKDKNQDSDPDQSPTDTKNSGDNTNIAANRKSDDENPFTEKATDFYISPSGDSIRIKDSIRYIDSVVVRDSIVIRDSIRIIDSTISKEDQKKNFQMDLQFFGGYEFSKPSYSSQGIISNDQEKGIGAVNSGLLFNMYFKDITAGIGLEYQSTGEKYNYSFTTTSNYDSVIISGYDSIPVYDSSGNVIVGYQPYPILDTVNYTDSTQTVSEGKNQYNWITVPIRFGYRFNIKSWAIIPRVGLNFHFGVANNNTNYLIPSTNVVESVPTKSFALSYHFQLEIRKTFQHFHIFLRPHYNGMFTPTHETSTYTRKYSSFGGQLGIGIQF